METNVHDFVSYDSPSQLHEPYRLYLIQLYCIMRAHQALYIKFALEIYTNSGVFMSKYVNFVKNADFIQEYAYPSSEYLHEDFPKPYPPPRLTKDEKNELFISSFPTSKYSLTLFFDVLQEENLFERSGKLSDSFLLGVNTLRKQINFSLRKDEYFECTNLCPYKDPQCNLLPVSDTSNRIEKLLCMLPPMEYHFDLGLENYVPQNILSGNF